jgi:hypothetical protein
MLSKRYYIPNTIGNRAIVTVLRMRNVVTKRPLFIMQ